MQTDPNFRFCAYPKDLILYILQATVSERVNTKIHEMGRKNSFQCSIFLIKILSQCILFILVLAAEEFYLKKIIEKTSLDSF